MRNKFLTGLSLFALSACASQEPKPLKMAEKAVERAEDKDADDLTPRMMELANMQLEKAEEMWEDAQDAREDKDYVKADNLTRQAMKLAKSSESLANNAVAINSDVVSWDKNPRQFAELKQDADMRDKLAQRVTSLQQDAMNYQTSLMILDETSKQAAQELVNSLPIAFFETNSAKPKDEFMPNAKRLASYLKANDGLQVKLKGFADPRGGEQKNKRLARERAMAIKSILTGQGIDSRRIEIASAGEIGNVQQADASQMQLYRKVEATIMN